ncbi:hypothetical protein FA13DRAFT_1798106 [Coprinellus micaceus]|uniref:Uncharacterized protein n=1 Tax=Coprinellus micaceus TaxID=71717 RepID=A0A4Y7SPY1_COPMI|nr:hypothetical protein FA13DRAFT_1798106 [Coprinellus micaceus]
MTGVKATDGNREKREQKKGSTNGIYHYQLLASDRKDRDESQSSDYQKSRLRRKGRPRQRVGCGQAPSDIALWAHVKSTRLRKVVEVTMLKVPHVIRMLRRQKIVRGKVSFGKVWDTLRVAAKVHVLKHVRLDHLKELASAQGWKRITHAGLRARVDDHIRSYFLPPVETRAMMQVTDTVLSGSAALKIADVSKGWDDGDLDFYTPNSQLCRVVNWFRMHGYKVTRVHDAPYDPKTLPQDEKEPVINRSFAVHSCMEQIVYLKHKVFNTVLNVIQSRSESALAPLTFFHSTLVMNFVSGNGVVCAYPKLTMNGKGMVNGVLSPGPGFEDTWSPRGTRAVAALIKYQDRGYKFVQGVEEDNTEQEEHRKGGP